MLPWLHNDLQEGNSGFNRCLKMIRMLCEADRGPVKVAVWPIPQEDCNLEASAFCSSHRHLTLWHHQIEDKKEVCKARMNVLQNQAGRAPACVPLGKFCMLPCGVDVHRTRPWAGARPACFVRLQNLIVGGLCSRSPWQSVKKSPSSAQQRSKQRQQGPLHPADGSVPLSPWAGPQADELRSAIRRKVAAFKLTSSRLCS